MNDDAEKAIAPFHWLLQREAVDLQTIASRLRIYRTSLEKLPEGTKERAERLEAATALLAELEEAIRKETPT